MTDASAAAPADTGQAAPEQALTSSRADVVRQNLSQKILALSNVIGQYEVGDVVDDAEDELRLCTAWAVAINDGAADLPPLAADQPLLDAIAAVDQAIAVNTAVNNLVSAVTTLIANYKAPGG